MNPKNNNNVSFISKAQSALRPGATFLFFDAEHQEIQCAIRLDVQDDKVLGTLRADSLLLDRVRCGCQVGFSGEGILGRCSFEEGRSQGSEIEVTISFDSFEEQATTLAEGAVPRT